MLNNMTFLEIIIEMSLNPVYALEEKSKFCG